MRKNIGASFLEQKLFEYGLRAIEMISSDQYKLISFSIFLGTEKKQDQEIIEFGVGKKANVNYQFWKENEAMILMVNFFEQDYSDYVFKTIKKNILKEYGQVANDKVKERFDLLVSTSKNKIEPKPSNSIVSEKIENDFVQHFCDDEIFSVVKENKTKIKRRKNFNEESQIILCLNLDAGWEIEFYKTLDFYFCSVYVDEELIIEFNTSDEFSEWLQKNEKCPSN